MGPLTYKDAGVDLDVYRESMSRLPKMIRRTHSPRVMHLDGGFAGLFQLDFDSPLFARNYRDPVLVSCTDGVGTKIKIAQAAQIHNTVGVDLVAMSVNDALCCGAEPLFFLDYIAMSKDDPQLVEQLVEGVSAGCVEADCALLGGETAIMPDIYRPGEYDLAGFCVGVAERRGVLDGGAIVPGDVVWGVASSGLHSNGFSLVRKIVFDHAGLALDEHVDELGATVGEALLTPTRIYTKALRQIQRSYPGRKVIHGAAHITGGGLAENLERILPARRQAALKKGSWQAPPVFDWLARLGQVEPAEMDRVFNMGVGMALVFNPHFARTISDILSDHGFDNWEIGVVAEGERSVTWVD